MTEVELVTDPNDKCPLCNAELKGVSAEKAVRPLGHKGRGNTIAVGQRNEYVCGAVKLTNKQFPDGTVEATCCVPMTMGSAQSGGNQV
jgi:hypothetical protein